MNQRPPVIAKVTEGDSASPVCFSSLYAYELDPEFRLVLRAGRKGMPPFIKLDDRYKLVDQLEDLIVHGVPSLARCRSLTIEGNVQFQSGVEIVGDVKFVNQDETRKEIPAGVYDRGCLVFITGPDPIDT